jgi:hypothetical protein
MQNSFGMSELYFEWPDKHLQETALENFERLIAGTNLQSFSIILNFDIYNFDLDLDILSHFNEALEQFFSNNGENCHKFTIYFNCPDIELYDVVFSKFKYLNNLMKLKIEFRTDVSSDGYDNQPQFVRLITYLNTFPAPEKLSLLHFDLYNVSTGEGNNSDLTYEEETFLDFIRSCHHINRFEICANYISEGLYRQLNIVLKQLGNLESVVIDYKGAGVDLSPLTEILQNQHIKELTFLMDNPIMRSADIIPAHQLRELQHVVNKNRGLDSLVLDFTYAFEEDNGIGFFDVNEDAYLTSEFLLFLKQLSSMVCLKTLKILLPAQLRPYMNDIFQQTELNKLFDNIKGSTQVDIRFMKNALSYLNEMSLQTSERGEELCRVMSSSEYTNFSMNLNQLDKYPSLLNISKNLSHFECLQLDIKLFYYLIQQQSMLEIVKANGDGCIQHSKLVHNFIFALHEQFARKVGTVDLVRISVLFEIFKYLDLNALFSIVLTVGGFHRYLKDATSIIHELSSEKRTPAKKDNIFNNTRLLNADRTVNNEHLYTCEDINAILRSRFANREDVAVMAPLHINDGRFRDLFHDAFIENKGKTLLFPILIDEHWVGIRLIQTDDGIEIHFYDSLVSQERLEFIQNELRAAFPNEAMQFISMDDPYLQADYTSCGAYLIENIFRDLNHLPREENITSEQIRALHLDLLDTYYPLYNSTQIPNNNKRKRESSVEEIDELFLADIMDDNPDFYHIHDFRT